jgi:hypothetical protein
MMDFSLTLNFNSTDFSNIKAENLMIAKAVASAGSPSGPSVVWLSFAPWANNVITWTENYGLYAMQGKAQNGATIRCDAQNTDNGGTASDGPSYYTFADREFSGPLSDGGQKVAPGSYGIFNNNINNMSTVFGLCQAASVSGTPVPLSAINALDVPKAQLVTFTPITTIYIWLEKSGKQGTILNDVKTGTTTIQMVGDTPVTLTYNGDTGLFETAPVLTF